MTIHWPVRATHHPLPRQGPATGNRVAPRPVP
jgi:hypothetical protein